MKSWDGTLVIIFVGDVMLPKGTIKNLERFCINKKCWNIFGFNFELNFSRKTRRSGKLFFLQSWGKRSDHN